MREENRIISLSAAGLDSPGLVSKITTRIFEMKGNIIDVEESCRRGLFSIFLIIDFTSSEAPIGEITEKLKAIEEETDLRLILGVYGDKEIRRHSMGENHVVTVLGVDQPGIIAEISTYFHSRMINIESCRMIARGRVFSMEMVIDTGRMAFEPPFGHEESLTRMKRELRELCAGLNQSLVIQSEDVYNRRKKLVVFDVESSLVSDSSLKDFLKRVEGKIRSNHREASAPVEGEDKLQNLIENARKLKGIPLLDLKRFSENLELNPGTLELIRILKSMGFKIALLSSGFGFILKRIFETAGVDYAFSNTLQVDENGVVTGDLAEPVITADSKEEFLGYIMKTESLSRDQVIAVGNGSTGSHFIENVGLSIAFRPVGTDIRTDGILSSDNLINVLYCLGIPKTELDKYFKGSSET